MNENLEKQNEKLPETFDHGGGVGWFHASPRNFKINYFRVSEEPFPVFSAVNFPKINM